MSRDVGMWVLGVLGAVAVVVVLLVTSSRDSSPLVTTSRPVHVVFTRNAVALGASDVPLNCAGLSVDATAIGGTQNVPVVDVTTPQCFVIGAQITPSVGVSTPEAPP